MQLADKNEPGVNRKTASKYLKQLVDNGYLKLLKIGTSNFYLNEPLFDLFINAHHGENNFDDVPLIESMD